MSCAPVIAVKVLHMFTQQTVVCFDQNTRCRQLLPTCSCRKISFFKSVFIVFVFFFIGSTENISIVGLYLCIFDKDDVTFAACFNGS